ncbi:biosynthetic-type acetolactate synthase large subunit [Candidatus Peregrinibacteria bacterium]|mgnify:CR=1 FL=1|nr:biosynthetic-type acetolactate synthase large subunit [Candidatus Peregrinibacteria bacterium]
MSDKDLKLGSEIFCDALLEEGVDLMFGIPGGVILPLYDKLNKFGHHVRHILPRHEQGGGFAADGYARVTGRTGVAIGTSGPGATNLLTAIANSMLDSVPVVYITGQVTADMMGTDAFQETDIIGMTMPIVKHSELVTDAKDVARAVKEAFHIANSGRPGPVHIDFTKDAWVTKAEQTPYEEIKLDLPGYSPLPDPQATDEEIKKLEELLDDPNTKPMIIAGHGVEIAKAQKELLEFAEKHNIPVCNTLLGLSTFPQDHKLFAGMIGMHGDAVTNYAVHDANLVISVGSRFDDRIFGNLEAFCKDTKFVHIDIDISEFHKMVKTDLPLAGDAKDILERANTLIGKEHKYPEWWKQIEEWKKEYGFLDFKVNPVNDDTFLSQPRIVKMISDATNGEAIVSADVGRHQMWTGRFYRFKHPNSHLSSGGLGSMGYGLPAAIGAALGVPGREVWVINGDGGIQMNIQEFATIKEHNLPIKIAIMEDSSLGMVRQWQNLLFQGNLSHSVLKNPDFVKIAEANGIPAFRAKTYEEAEEAIKKVREINGPALITFMVDPDEHVFPMVPPNTPLNEQALSNEDLLNDRKKQQPL